jgi:hypothetical protein
LNITHGVAVKLINIYLKSLLVCGGYDSHEKVKALHPSIDSILLTELAERDIGGLREYGSAMPILDGPDFLVMNMRT